MKKIDAFETKDGSVFKHKQKATAHERSLKLQTFKEKFEMMCYEALGFKYIEEPNAGGDTPEYAAWLKLQDDVESDSNVQLLVEACGEEDFDGAIYFIWETFMKLDVPLLEKIVEIKKEILSKVG